MLQYQGRGCLCLEGCGGDTFIYVDQFLGTAWGLGWPRRVGKMVESEVLPSGLGAANPLVSGISEVLGRVADFKSSARAFFFDVVLSPHPCPECNGRLRMTGSSQCACGCGRVLDPTVEFQRSACCGARVTRRVCHYVCASCGRVAPSRFLFDERVFDKEYFRLRMAQSREAHKQKREELRLLLAASRSKPLAIAELATPDSVPGFLDDLNEFLNAATPEAGLDEFAAGRSEFCMEAYKAAILDYLGECRVLFGALPRVEQDDHLDRIWRFVTLVYLWHDGLVDLFQRGEEVEVVRCESVIEG